MRMTMVCTTVAVTMLASMSTMWLVNTRHTVHEIAFVSFFGGHAWKVTESNQVENITGQRNERGNQHD